MSNPNFLPYLIGVTLDSNGVAFTQVVAYNRSNGNRLIGATDTNKLVVFDISDFQSGYAVNDVIEFINVGSSVGSNTVTISSASAGLSEVTITCAAAPTVSVNL